MIPPRSCRKTMGLIPSLATASMIGFEGKHASHSNPSFLRIFATASYPFMFQLPFLKSRFQSSGRVIYRPLFSFPSVSWIALARNVDVKRVDRIVSNVDAQVDFGFAKRL